MTLSEKCVYYCLPTISEMEAIHMNRIAFPVIDPVATGENIQRLRRERGLTVRDLQMFFGFEEPQAIYKWQRGKSLPSVDNLYALSALLDVSMDDIIVSRTVQLNQYKAEQQAAACCSAFLSNYFKLSTNSSCAGPSTKGLYTETTSPLVLMYRQVCVPLVRSTYTAKPT